MSGFYREEVRRHGPERARAAAAGVVQSRTHVLILDDHAPSREICAGYCDLFDHTTETIGQAREAMAALRRARFGAALINVHADAWDALELIPAIRALPGHAGRTPLIGLTAVGRGHEAQRWLSAGLAAVLPKPITAARLFAALGAALDDRARRPRSWAPVD